MRASSLLAFRCYFELPSINKDFTYAFLPHERLLNGPVTSVRWRLAFVLKEPICCYLHDDTSVIYHVLMHCLSSFLLQDICFRGAK